MKRDTIFLYGRLHIVKMLILILIYKFKIIPIKILAGFFIVLHKLTLKSYKDKLPKNVQEKEQ